MSNEICPRCNGSRKVIRNMCGFKVEIDCDKCNGVTTVVSSYDIGGGQTRETCGQCNGSGERKVPIDAPFDGACGNGDCC